MYQLVSGSDPRLSVHVTLQSQADKKKPKKQKKKQNISGLGKMYLACWEKT